MNTERLWNLKQLLVHYPAFKEWGVRHLIRYRRIPLVKIGKRIYFRPERIDEWIRENEIKIEGKQ